VAGPQQTDQPYHHRKEDGYEPCAKGVASLA